MARWVMATIHVLNERFQQVERLQFARPGVKELLRHGKSWVGPGRAYERKDEQELHRGTGLVLIAAAARKFVAGVESRNELASLTMASRCC